LGDYLGDFYGLWAIFSQNHLVILQTIFLRVKFQSRGIYRAASESFISKFFPGANPTIASYKTNAVKIYE
jgi:hypothetical protein